MKELLSANELNDLLTAVSEGQVQTAPTDGTGRQRNVQPCDFRRPDRLSRGQLRVLQQIHERIAVGVSSTLGELLRTPVEATVVALELSTYAAFNSSASSPSCVQTFRTRPGDARGVLSLDIPLAYGIIDRLLGGQGAALAANKPLTQIEQAIIASPLRTILEQLGAGWGPWTPVVFQPLEMAMDPRAVQILGGKEMVLQVGIALSGEACVGDLNLCLPFDAVERLVSRERADRVAGAGDGEAAGDARERLRRAVRAAPVEVAVELGRATISVRELLNLQPGHVVRLDARVGRTLDVTVEGDVYLAGQPGLVGQRRGVQLTHTPPPPGKGAEANG
jgi:flagellar motor switch protein FliM